MIRTRQEIAAVVREHRQALHIGSMVTQWFRKDREPQVLQVTPENVIAVLAKAGIRCVLMGVHGINVYRSEARASQDVDVLVTKREVRKAVRALEREFPYLEVVDLPVVARFRDPVSQKVVIDVMKPAARALQAVFRHTIAIGETYRIPDLEMALYSKFVAMHAPNRRPAKRHLDAADFTDIVQNNRERIDLKKLERLADGIEARSGAKLLRLIDDVDAGRVIPLPHDPPRTTKDD